MEGEKVICLEQEEVEDDSMLPGFRFHPTDEELVGFYLRRKVAKKPISIEIIRQINIYKYDPWDLPKFSTVGVGDKEWYFFCLRGRKYRNSIRPNRVTSSGFWKATGIDKPVYSGKSGCIGLKKSLVYYRGSAGKGTKTDWMMQEFRLPPEQSSGPKNDNNANGIQEAEIWTICRIFKRKVSSNYKRYAPCPTLTTDSSTSLNSETNGSDDFYKCFETPATQESEIKTVRMMSSCAGQEQCCSSQAPLTSMIQSTSTNDMMMMKDYNDVNWDELGRIMDQCMFEPAGPLVDDCGYIFNYI